MTSAVISPGADRSMSASMSATRIGQSTTAGDRRSITGPVHVACVDSHCRRVASMLASASSIASSSVDSQDVVDLLGEIARRAGERLESGNGDVVGERRRPRRPVTAGRRRNRRRPRACERRGHGTSLRGADSQRLHEGEQPAAILDRRLAERGRRGLALRRRATGSLPRSSPPDRRGAGSAHRRGRRRARCPTAAACATPPRSPRSPADRRRGPGPCRGAAGRCTGGSPGWPARRRRCRRWCASACGRTRTRTTRTARRPRAPPSTRHRASPAPTACGRRT